MGAIEPPNWLVLIAAAIAAISFASACERCVYKTKVSYFPSDKSPQSGACGYGPSGIDFNGSHVAAASPTIFQNGFICGACFQVRCTGHAVCRPQGTTFVVIDEYSDGKTDFRLSQRAFESMANNGTNSVQDLLKRGKVSVEYKRVPCFYKKNLTLQVDESSQINKPMYLAVKLLNLAGQTDMKSVELAQYGKYNWFSMDRTLGAVWSTNNVPSGALLFRFNVTGGTDEISYSSKTALPGNWGVGDTLDTGLKITDIAQVSCSPCDNRTWGPGPHQT